MDQINIDQIVPRDRDTLGQWTLGSNIYVAPLWQDRRRWARRD